MEIRTVAGVQTDVAFQNPESNVQQMLQWMVDPGVGSSNLIVFPECMVSGYCFESRAEGMEFAQPVPGPATEQVQSECRPDQYVAFGMLERTSDGRLYNSCVLVGREGLVGRYRKIHLPSLGIDRFVDPGPDPFRIWTVGGMRIGMQICYDGGFPEGSRALTLAGADLLILPTNWPPGAETFARYLPNARALENNVYFMAVNRIGVERGFRFIGQSKLCDTIGNSMAEAGDSDQAVVMGEIDLEMARNKKLVRVPGKHSIDRIADRRPEFYVDLCKPKSS
jgi:predicted amidohydrolase